MMGSSSDRITWVDNVKGLLLLLNCSSHIIMRPPLISLIVGYTSTYYVPLFVFLSGYLCKPNLSRLSKRGGYKKLIEKRFRLLLIPYFFFSLFALVHGWVDGKDVSQMLWQMFYEGRGCFAATPLYFVTLLFVVSLSFTWIVWDDKLSKERSLAIIIICLIFFWLLTKDVGWNLPWHLNRLPFYGAYFLTGYMVRLIENRCKVILDSTNKETKTLLVSGVLLIMGWLGFVIPISGTFLAYVCPISLIVGIIILINLYPRVGFSRKPYRFLRYIAINGIIILGTHDFVNGYYHYILKHYGIVLNEWGNFISSFIIIAVTLYFVIVPIMNNYLYKVLGKSSSIS